VAVSPDGSYFVSVSQDDTIKTWDCSEVLAPATSSSAATAAAPTTCSREYFANNNEGRKWLCSLRPVFDLKHARTFVIGSMEAKRSLNMFTLRSKKEAHCHEGGHIESVINYWDQVSENNLS
jgi:hypothetical protein